MRWDERWLVTCLLAFEHGIHNRLQFHRIGSVDGCRASCALFWRINPSLLLSIVFVGVFPMDCWGGWRRERWATPTPTPFPAQTPANPHHCVREGCPTAPISFFLFYHPTRGRSRWKWWGISTSTGRREATCSSHPWNILIMERRQIPARTRGEREESKRPRHSRDSLRTPGGIPADISIPWSTSQQLAGPATMRTPRRPKRSLGSGLGLSTR